MNQWDNFSGDDFICPSPSCMAVYEIKLNRGQLINEDCARCVKCNNIMMMWCDVTYPIFTLKRTS